MTPTDELRAAETIARDAGALALSYFRGDRLDTRSKGARDLVTAADTAGEELIVRRLAAEFPGDGVVAEEGSRVDASSGRLWYVDPLDGTLNYAHGLPCWCVSMALVQDGRSILGVVYDPTRGESFTAVRGGGSACNGVRIVCAGRERLEDALVHITVDFKEAGYMSGLDDLQRVAPRVLRTRNLGSAALALAYVAAGRFDAMLHRFAYPWDYGAGVLLIEEAGGYVTDIGGEPYTPERPSVLAAGSRPLHAALRSILQGTEGTPLE